MRRVNQQALDGVAGGVRHQGAAARYAAARTWDEHELPALVEAAEGRALLLVLDGVQDPHNLGAIIRSAAAWMRMKLPRVLTSRTRRNPSAVTLRPGPALRPE